MGTPAPPCGIVVVLWFFLLLLHCCSAAVLLLLLLLCPRPPPVVLRPVVSINIEFIDFHCMPRFYCISLISI